MSEILYNNFSKFLDIKSLKNDSDQQLKNLLVKHNIEKLDLLDSIKYLYLLNLSKLNYQVRLINKTNKRILGFSNNSQEKNKDYYRGVLSPKRKTILLKNINLIKKNENYTKIFFASPREVINSNFDVIIEECITKEQVDIFNYCKHISSIPCGEYVGRRMKYLIRDDSYSRKPIIGIAALGSSVVKLKARDEWLGWNEYSKLKMKRLRCIMDMYVCISIPPYNQLLSGKLICYAMTSNEVRDMFRQKYNPTVNSNQELSAIITTTFFGTKSSQYNRIKYYDKQLYYNVGATIGYGKSFIDDELYEKIKILLSEKTQYKKYKFNGGTNSSFRLLRNGIRKIKGDEELLLRHSLKKGIYVAPLVSNLKDYLKGVDNKIIPYDYPLNELVDYWKKRWLSIRLLNNDIIKRIKKFDTQQLILSKQINS